MIQHSLQAIERLGNRIPHPALLFFWLCIVMLLLSAVAGFIGLEAVHPAKQTTVAARSLISADGLRFIITGMVEHFITFAPLGVVLVAMLGIGIADKSRLLHALLTGIVTATPARLLTMIVAFAGIMSSLAADAGYVILIPLSAMLFSMAGRSPMAGIATAFAAVSAGYSANLLIGPIDALLSGLSTAAAHFVDDSITVSASANWYFNALSVLLLAGLITLVTERLPWPDNDDNSSNTTAPAGHSKLWPAGLFSLLFIITLSLLTIPDSAALRHPQTGALAPSPLVDGIVVIVSLYFAGAGIVFGFSNGHFRRGAEVITAMEETMRSMAPYLVMMFFAALFIAWFQWSNLGLLLAISGAEWLGNADINRHLLMVLFIAFSALINLFIGSSSAKWALMAPVFVPMLLLAGIEPQVTQQAYRIGDSSTNIISPLMPYFALVLGFVQQYDKSAGVGTLIAAMLPYAITMLLGWSLLFTVYLWLQWPLGL